MSERIVIFGFGGFGREVHEMILDINRSDHRFDLVGFLDGNQEAFGSIVHDLPVLGGPEWVQSNPGVNVVLALGSPVSKKRVLSQFDGLDANFPAIVSPRAWIGDYVEIGAGSIICAGTIVTTDVEIGSFCTLNLNVTVGHDVTIGDYATLAPAANVSGNVHIRTGCEFGTNAIVIPSVEIGEWSIIGAGTVVTGDLPANVTAVGAPAKVIKQRDPGWQN